MYTNKSECERSVLFTVAGSRTDFYVIVGKHTQRVRHLPRWNIDHEEKGHIHIRVNELQTIYGQG